MAHDHWRDLEQLGPRWSVAVTGHDYDGGPGIQIDAFEQLTLLGTLPRRARVIGRSVAEATPKLLRQIERLT